MSKMLILLVQLVAARQEVQGPERAPWVDHGVVVRYSNPGTVRGNNAARWDRLNLSPRGVEPAPVAKRLGRW